MSFDVAAEAYRRFMGRFSEPLAPVFAEFAGVRPGMSALDVGCGPGALTAPLVRALGASSVAAIDPSASFVAATRERFPGVDVRDGVAEHLPFADASFGATLAQLVVHFMADPVAGLAEMARVTRPGGVVAACVWDHGGGAGPLGAFWRAVHDLDPDATDEPPLAGSVEGQLAELFAAAGMDAGVRSDPLSVTVPFATFDAWWEPFTLGVGPAGAYVATIDDDARAALRDRCAALLPAAGFEVTALAWGARAIVGRRQGSSA